MGEIKGWERRKGCLGQWMLIQRNDNKKKANGNLDHLGTPGEVCLALNICPHYIWCSAHVVRRKGLACFESPHKTSAELSWCFGWANFNSTEVITVLIIQMGYFTIKRYVTGNTVQGPDWKGRWNTFSLQCAVERGLKRLLIEELEI